MQIVFTTSFGLTQPKCIENLDKILIDAKEREVYRSIDYQTQQEYYFGKKKRILSRIT